MVVQSGFGSVEYSRAIKGGSHYSRGEWRGGVLTPAPTSVELVPGVIVRVPAGVLHLVRPLGEAPLVYLVLKEKVSPSCSPDNGADGRDDR